MATQAELGGDSGVASVEEEGGNKGATPVGISGQDAPEPVVSLCKQGEPQGWSLSDEGCLSTPGLVPNSQLAPLGAAGRAERQPAQAVASPEPARVTVWATETAQGAPQAATPEPDKVTAGAAAPTLRVVNPLFEGSANTQPGAGGEKAEGREWHRMVASFQVRVNRALRKRRARWKAQLMAKAVETKRQEEANAERLVCLVGSETKLECSCLVCAQQAAAGGSPREDGNESEEPEDRAAYKQYKWGQSMQPRSGPHWC